MLEVSGRDRGGESEGGESAWGSRSRAPPNVLVAPTAPTVPGRRCARFGDLASRVRTTNVALSFGSDILARVSRSDYTHGTVRESASLCHHEQRLIRVWRGSRQRQGRCSFNAYCLIVAHLPTTRIGKLLCSSAVHDQFEDTGGAPSKKTRGSALLQREGDHVDRRAIPFRNRGRQAQCIAPSCAKDDANV